MNLKNKKFSRLYRLHRWAGIFLLPHILVLTLTGTILVFRHELEHLLQSDVGQTQQDLPKAAPPISLQSLVDQSLQLYPQDRPIAVVVDDHDPDKLTVRMGIDGSRMFSGARRVVFDKKTGRPAAELQNAVPVLDFILRLHREFLLGFYGKLYVSLVGSVFAFSILSGLVIYGPMMKKLFFGNIRLGPNVVWTWSDIHKIIGTVTFVWCLLMALSGFFLGISGQLLKLFQFTTLKNLNAEFAHVAQPKQIISLDQALQQLESIRPQSRMTFVSFPDTQFSTLQHYIFVVQGTQSWDERLSELVLVNASMNVPPEVKALPWYLKAVVLSEPLHFGNYGGQALKTIWVLFSLSSLVLPVSGFMLILRRRRSRIVQRVPIKIRSIQLGAAYLAKPYLMPLLIATLTLAAILTALLLQGAFDIMAAVLLLIPLLLLALSAKSFLDKSKSKAAE